jgi:hypothetical protein
MLTYTEEEAEALESLCSHVGLRLLLREIDDIINTMQKGYLSVPLDNDPQTAALSLLQERYKIEGATVIKSRLLERVKRIKEKS